MSRVHPRTPEVAFAHPPLDSPHAGELSEFTRSDASLDSDRDERSPTLVTRRGSGHAVLGGGGLGERSHNAGGERTYHGHASAAPAHVMHYANSHSASHLNNMESTFSMPTMDDNEVTMGNLDGSTPSSSVVPLKPFNPESSGVYELEHIDQHTGHSPMVSQKTVLNNGDDSGDSDGGGDAPVPLALQKPGVSRAAASSAARRNISLPFEGKSLELIGPAGFLPDAIVEQYYMRRVQSRIKRLTPGASMLVFLQLLVAQFLQTANAWIPMMPPTPCMSVNNVGFLFLAAGNALGPNFVTPWVIRFWSGTNRKIPHWEIFVTVLLSLFVQLLPVLIPMWACTFPFYVAPVWVPIIFVFFQAPLAYLLQPAALKYNRVVMKRTLYGAAIVFVGMALMWLSIVTLVLIYYSLRADGTLQIMVLIIFRIAMVAVRNAMTFAMRLLPSQRPARQIFSFVASFWIEYTIIVVLPTSSSVGVYLLEASIAIIFQVGSVWSLHQPSRDLVRRSLLILLPRRLHWTAHLWAQIDDNTRVEITSGIGFEIISHVMGTLAAYPLICALFFGPSKAYFPYALLSPEKVGIAVGFAGGKITIAVILAFFQRIWLKRQYGVDLLRAPAGLVQEFMGLTIVVISAGLPLPLYIMTRQFAVQYTVTPEAYGI